MSDRGDPVVGRSPARLPRYGSYDPLVAIAQDVAIQTGAVMLVGRLGSTTTVCSLPVLTNLPVSEMETQDHVIMIWNDCTQHRTSGVM